MVKKTVKLVPRRDDTSKSLSVSSAPPSKRSDDSEEAKVRDTIREILSGSTQAMSKGMIFSKVVNGEKYDGNNVEHKKIYRTVASVLESFTKQGVVNKGAGGSTGATGERRTWDVYSWAAPSVRLSDEQLSAVAAGGTDVGIETKKIAAVILNSLPKTAIYRFIIEQRVEAALGESAASRVDAALDLLVRQGLAVQEFPDEYRKSDKSDLEAKEILGDWETFVSNSDTESETETAVEPNDLNDEQRADVTLIHEYFDRAMTWESACRIYRNEVDKNGPEWRKRYQK